MALLVLLAGPAQAANPKLLIACAASAVDAVADLARAFERESGVAVDVTPGSSGKFYHQITQGAPFDLFFSADTDYPARLEKGKYTAARRHYARGRIVLWVRNEAPRAEGLDVLARPAVRRVAVANPRVAPYGRAALQALDRSGTTRAVRPKLVMGENIGQTAQFVESGAADVGILSLSLALSPRLREKGRYWLIPARLHDPIDSDAVVLAGSGQVALARRFLDYATSAAVAPVWIRYGLR